MAKFEQKNIAARSISTRNSILAEGPYWDIDAKVLWWVDIVEKKLLSWSERTGETCIDAPYMLSAVLQVDTQGVLLASEHGLVRYHNGDFCLCQRVPQMKASQRSNESQIDPFGRVLISSLDKQVRANDGELVLINGDSSQTILSNIGIPNTLQWSRDQRTLYFADSRAQRIYRYDYHGDDPILRNRQCFFSTEGTQAVPDGSAIDNDGYLWTALWDGYCVVRLSPLGDVDRVINLPVARPTSCAFGGADNQMLFITTASKDLSEQQRRKQPDAGKVFAAFVGVSGAAPFTTNQF